MYIFIPIFIIIISVSCYITTKDFDWLIPIFYLKTPRRLPPL